LKTLTLLTTELLKLTIIILKDAQPVVEKLKND